MHGYQLAELIEHSLLRCTDLKKVTPYFLIDKMAVQGWVKGRMYLNPATTVFAPKPNGQRSSINVGFRGVRNHGGQRLKQHRLKPAPVRIQTG